MAFGIGTTELMIIGGIFVLIFGAGSLIKWAKAFGGAKKEFNKAVKELDLPTEENKK